MVTKSTFPTNDWSKKYENTLLSSDRMNTQATAVLGAVSRENGVDLLMTFDKSVNVPKFLSFLENLRQKFINDNIILVMDNLRVHTCNQSKERMNQLGFRHTWTPRYQP